MVTSVPALHDTKRPASRHLCISLAVAAELHGWGLSVPGSRTWPGWAGLLVMVPLQDLPHYSERPSERQLVCYEDTPPGSTLGGARMTTPSTQSCAIVNASSRHGRHAHLMPSSPATSTNLEGSGGGGRHTSSTALSPWHAKACTEVSPESINQRHGARLQVTSWH